MDPLVSVLVPTFNRAGLLRRALGSVLVQTYANLEIVVSDNHSTDETPAVVAEFARRDPRIRSLSSPPGNTSAMFNIRNALAAAQGKYAVLLADDDFFLDYRYISAGVEILQSQQVGLLIADCVLGRPRREITSLGLAPVTSGREFFLKFWRGKYQIPVISNLFDVELARRCNPWSEPEILYANVELWLKMMTLTDVAYYNYPAVYYHFHGRNIVSTISLEMHRQNIRFLDNAARFAAPVFGGKSVAEWKKSMLIEYWRIVLDENRRPGKADFAAFRATLGLDHESIGLRHWLRLMKYHRRRWKTIGKRYFRSERAAPTLGDGEFRPAA